jgi:hypothetical protein
VHVITIKTYEVALQDFDVVEGILDITRLSRKQRVSLGGIHFFPSPLAKSALASKTAIE